MKLFRRIRCLFWGHIPCEPTPFAFKTGSGRICWDWCEYCETPFTWVNRYPAAQEIELIASTEPSYIPAGGGYFTGSSMLTSGPNVDSNGGRYTKINYIDYDDNGLCKTVTLKEGKENLGLNVNIKCLSGKTVVFGIFESEDFESIVRIPYSELRNSLMAELQTVLSKAQDPIEIELPTSLFECAGGYLPSSNGFTTYSVSYKP